QYDGGKRIPAPEPQNDPRQLWPFCGQSSHELPLMATTSCFLERTLRVSKRKRTVYFSVSYRTAALAAESRLADSQSSNPGSIPGSATKPVTPLVPPAFTCFRIAFRISPENGATRLQ